MQRICSSSLMAALFLGLTAEANAYDTGHHFDLTREAMAEQGFSETAIQVGQVENWLVDYYSGREAGVEDAIKTDCDKLHADDMLNEASVKNYWDRFTTNAKAAFSEAASTGNPRQVLALLGMSLHTVQDFYSHSNWAEVQALRLPAGFDYSTLTYLDASPASRTGVKTGRSSRNDTPVPVHERHGGYTTGMNKDWYGKPNWDRTYVHAYAATRQWVNQARLWVGAVNPAVWEQAKRIALTSKQLGKLASDLRAAYRISEWVKNLSGSVDGHWKGKGSGDRAKFLAFTSSWITLSSDSNFVEDFKDRHWHRLLSGGLRGSLDLRIDKVVNPGAASPAPPPSPAPRMTILPINKRAVFLKTVSVRDLDNIDPIPYDDADFLAKITIHNQRFVEACQNGRDNLSPPWITMKFVDADIPVVAIHYELWDEDTTSGDDHLDIERRRGLRNLDFLYNMNTQRSGGIGIDGVFNSPSSLLVSRGTPGDHAEVKMWITTRTLGPAPRSLPPVFDSGAGTVATQGTSAQPNLPDLQITSFDVTQFTVTNAGTAAAGPFVVSVERVGVFPFPGLAAGASVSRPTVTPACSIGGRFTATADAQNQVAESNESNNARALGQVFC